MQVQYIGKHWTGNALYGQQVVNKVLNETWPKIEALLKEIMTDRWQAPRFRNRLPALRILMRQARNVAYLNHAQFFIVYGRIAQILTDISEEFYRRRALQERENVKVGREVRRIESLENQL